MKKILSILLVLALTLGAFASCKKQDPAASPSAPSSGTARTLDEIKSSGEVVIGVFSDKAPFGYVDKDGKYQGYDVYFGDRIAKDLGVTVKYVSVEPASRIEFLETAKVDIILANFTVTQERAEKVDFALPYMKVALGVVSPDSALITDVSQLVGKKLIVATGTTAETYFEANVPGVELVKFEKYTETFSALLDGRADAFSTDNTEVLAWAIANPGFTVGIPSLGSLDTIAPAVTKGNTALLNWLNDEIVALADEQFFHADYAATLASVYGDAVSPDELVVEGGVVDASPATPSAPLTLKIGATPTPHAEILAEAKKILAQQGVTLDIVEFTDYVQPNLTLEDGTIDANYFAHRPYLTDFNTENGTHIVDIADIHYEPFGIYPGKTKSLADLKDGAKVAVPNDTTNEARALLLLQEQGLITLKEGAGLEATKLDIIDNPKKLDIVELEAAQIPRSLPDVDIAVINGNYALDAGLSAATDALAIEAAGGIAAVTFANVIAVKAGNENNPAVQALIAVLRSDAIKQFITDTYGDAVIPSK
ncbi:MAG: transporter substrate-binding domain-containing protein [Oscillospiraceae bacterium]|jgi:YaeC family lipoprotein|nr:transporter substrate-binding domain-containing protein [Oscillospiraceae bacterium]